MPNGLAAWVALPTLDVLPEDSARLALICEEVDAKIKAATSYSELAEAGATLSAIDDPVAVPYLQEMALLKSGVLAPLAAKGLERVDGTPGVDALILLSKEPNTEISSPARASLARLMLVMNILCLKSK